MRSLVVVCLLGLMVCPAMGQSPDPPLDETKLSVSTLVREDVFAGWREDDMERFERGEKNLDLLLEQRPKARAEILVWKGGTKVYRAVLAHEAGKNEEYEKLYQESLDLFAEAQKLGPELPVVAAVVGGTYATFADRLPEKHRATAWATSYDCYQALWKQQGDVLEHLPVHLRGELLAGLAQSAERTGHKEQLDEYLKQIIKTLPDTGYERVAKQWQTDPLASAKGNISCKSCHAEGRLSERIAKLKSK